MEVSFTDNGVGIEALQLKWIFVMFSRLPLDTAQEGMGLSLCRKIICNHAGQVTLGSEEGTGTTVSVIKPWV